MFLIVVFIKGLTYGSQIEKAAKKITLKVKKLSEIPKNCILLGSVFLKATVGNVANDTCLNIQDFDQSKKR